MSDQLFALVMEHDPNLVFVKDERSVILYANDAFLDVYPPEKRGSVIGSTTVEDFSEEEANLFLAEDRRALERGRTEMVEEILDWAGRRRVFLTRKIAFRCANGEPRLLGICTDITELADREKRLVDVNSRLEKFSAFAAHDLRSPIASFASALELVRRDPETTLGPQSFQYVDMMIASADGLARQISSMLLASRAENAQQLVTQETDLNMVVEEVRFNLLALMQRTGTTLHSPRLPSMIVEPNLFRQLLQNLIENSIKHRSEKPPLIVVRHESTEVEDVLSVEDNGLGIAAGDVQRVFNAFEQGQSARGGNGIGLALCRRVVELHQGAIRVDESYVGGCRIVVTIPKVGHGARVGMAA